MMLPSGGSTYKCNDGRIVNEQLCSHLGLHQRPGQGRKVKFMDIVGESINLQKKFRKLDSFVNEYTEQVKLYIEQVQLYFRD